VATAQHAFVNGISGSLMFAAGIVAATALIVARLAPAPTRRANPAQGTTPVDAVQDLQQLVDEAFANAVEHAHRGPHRSGSVDTEYEARARSAPATGASRPAA
jgi:hypothetical protein